MRISDWSSDVCSSDLAQQNQTSATRDNWGTRSGHAVERIGYGESGPRGRTIDGELVAKSVADTQSKFSVGDRVFHIKFGNGNVAGVEGNKQIGRASCRERVCKYV